VTVQGLSLNLATVRAQFGFAAAVDACLAQGITAIAPWRDQVEAIGLEEAARIVRMHGLKVTGHCRGGMFPAVDKAGLAAAIDDNKRAIDEAAALGADCLVMVVGGLPGASKDIAAALAIEPLHPMYAADRACVNTLDQALDLCDALGAGVGVAIDVYHTWWDPNIRAQIARAGRNAQILAHHICDWLVPTRDLLLDRGMMGDGVIDLKQIRRDIEQAGFRGPQEVEIFSSENWWKRPGEEVIATCIERFRSVC